MMESDNGAAVVVAQNVSGSILKFADRMNEKARELGCRKTHFSNPHGLTARWHYSSARDMAKIAAYCMKNPDFRKIVNHQKSVIRWSAPSGKSYKSETTNELLGSYRGANGIKTGWTKAAEGCVAASAKRGDVELIAVVMKSKDNDTRFADARKLLDYGFSVGGEGKIPVEPPVKAGTKQMPHVKRPGTAATPAVTTKPVSEAASAVKQPEANQQPATAAPAAKQPAVKEQAATTVPVEQQPAVKQTPVVSNKPVTRTAGVRMPVVRKPGA